MSAGPHARVRRSLGRAVGLGSALAVGIAEPAAAHEVGNGAMPAPPWLLAYLGAFAVLATAVALRSTWPRARSARAATPAGAPAGRQPIGIGNLVAVVLLGLVLAAAVVGPDSGAANIAPVAVLVVWWVGLPLAALLLGDVLRAANPFVGLVRVAERLRPAGAPARGAAPSWTPAAFLFAFGWFFVAYHRPGSPRAVAVFLALYVVAAVGAGLRWGSRWLATGEGFGALSAAVSTVAPVRRSPAPPGTAPLMVVWLGTVVFDAFASTPFWEDVAADVTGWERTLRSTAGLVWMTALVAAAYLGALAVGARRAGRAVDGEAAPTADLRAALGVGLVPVALAWFVGHDLTLLLFEGQNFVALLSDPIGRGWDLAGTISQTVDYGLAQAAWVPWVQVVAVLGGHLAAVVVAHDAALQVLRRPVAARVTLALSAAFASSVAAAALLVLG